MLITCKASPEIFLFFFFFCFVLTSPSSHSKLTFYLDNITVLYCEINYRFHFLVDFIRAPISVAIKLLWILSHGLTIEARRYDKALRPRQTVYVLHHLRSCKVNLSNVKSVLQLTVSKWTNYSCLLYKFISWDRAFSTKISEKEELSSPNVLTFYLYENVKTLTCRSFQFSGESKVLEQVNYSVWKLQGAFPGHPLASCFSKSDIREKDFEQRPQEYFLTSECVCKCARRLDLSAKARWQFGHL